MKQSKIVENIEAKCDQLRLPTMFIAKAYCGNIYNYSSDLTKSINV